MPDSLGEECLKEGYRLACEALNTRRGSVALAMAITRGGEIKHHLTVDGNPQAAQAWISAGIAARQYAQVLLFMTVRPDDPQVDAERLLACYMDSPGRWPATLILRPIEMVDGIATLGAMTAERASESQSDVGAPRDAEIHAPNPMDWRELNGFQVDPATG